MSHQLLSNNSVVQAGLRTDIPEFSVGSVVEVHYKIVEGGKERIQIFKGLVTNLKNGKGINGTFTVLKVATAAIKVERTFPLHSPMISKVVVEVNQRARRANLRSLQSAKEPVKALRGKAKKVVA